MARADCFTALHSAMAGAAAFDAGSYVNPDQGKTFPADVTARLVNCYRRTPAQHSGATCVMSKTTRATQALSKLGVKFALHLYDYDPGADRIGLQAAEALGVEPRRVLKTLMAEV